MRRWALLAGGGAVTALVIASIAAGAMWLRPAPEVPDSKGGDASFQEVERGRYLATLGDCAACHTKPGGMDYAGGVPIKTPFGVLVGANITMDAETGIGRWSEGDFQRAMSEGIGRGGYHLYGAMPFTAFTKLTKADNSAIWAFIKTLPPVANAVEANQLPFPFNIRLSLIGWNMLNFSKGEFQPNNAKSAEWNRGAYIVEGPGHCGTCHTPKNLIGGDKSAQALAGNVVDGWLAPNITADAQQGIGSWSVDDIAEYLKTGANKFDIASGSMAEEVEKSSQHWTDNDLKAVAAYLKDVEAPASIASKPLTANSPVMIAGQAIYADRCSGCHVSTGEGAKGLFPKLAQAPLVVNDDATSLIRVVLAGSRAGATDASPTGPTMPSFAWNLKDDEVANVLTFVRNAWGNAADSVSAADVARIRKSAAE